MEKMKLKKMDALTEKGFLKAVVRDGLKDQFEEKYLQELTKQKDGSYTLDLVEDTSGKVIRAWVKVSITAKEDFDPKGKAKTEEKEIVVPQIF